MRTGRGSTRAGAHIWAICVSSSGISSEQLEAQNRRLLMWQILAPEVSAFSTLNIK